jgi:hypothetical protein
MDHYVDRPARMGPSVLISESWYNSKFRGHEAPRFSAHGLKLIDLNQRVVPYSPLYLHRWIATSNTLASDTEPEFLQSASPSTG